MHTSTTQWRQTTHFSYQPAQTQPAVGSQQDSPHALAALIGRSPEQLSRTTLGVLKMLISGDLSRLRSNDIADELAISPTTLRRRLRADELNYQDLLDRIRQHRCMKMLEGRWLPGKSVAWELGYMEVNSFYRAFRRWTGTRYSDAKLDYI